MAHLEDKIFISALRKGIKRAEKKNGKWEIEDTLEDKDIRCLASHASDRNTLFAGTQGEGIYISNDQGESWSFLGMKETVVKSIVSDPHDPQRLFAGVKPANVFVSNNGGKEWAECESFRKLPDRLTWFSPAEPPYQAYVYALIMSPERKDHIIAGIEFGGIYLSDDGGKTWKGHQKDALKDCHSLFAHPVFGQYAYEGGGTGAGAAITRDGGKHWEQDKKGMDRHYGWAVTADPQNPETWFIAASTGPFKAHGNGDAQAYIYRKKKEQPWEKLSGGLPSPLPHMPYTLLTDKNMPGWVIAGMNNGDIWYSNNNGDDWQQLDINLGKNEKMLMI